MGRHTIGPALSGLGEGLAGRNVLVPLWRAGHSARWPGVESFLRHIGAAGFRVKQAVCQEAVQLGRVVFWSMHGSRPLPLTSPYRCLINGTRPKLPIGYHRIGEK